MQYSFLKLRFEMKDKNSSGYSTTKGANVFNTWPDYQFIMDFMFCKKFRKNKTFFRSASIVCMW